MTEAVLLGPFLTRRDAARRAGVSMHDLSVRPDLLRLPGVWLEETYFAFQFTDRGIHPELARVVVALKKRSTDVAIADWLARPHPKLAMSTPLDRLRHGEIAAEILAAARESGPAPSPVAKDAAAVTVKDHAATETVTLVTRKAAVSHRPRLAG